ncbi:GNAT family N-acetyltransferase [Niallia nealsonii]|uniref:GNAT family N-acetyltransferase n=1 Tax=Niallia nealsonii TaxID=115979 RepID=UPI0026C3BBC8
MAGKRSADIQLKDDDAGIHFGLFKNKQLSAVLSLFIKEDTAQFRKFATLQEEQGKGYGSMLLTYVMDYAKKQGVKKICCNARGNKVAFYQKFDLEASDGTFAKGGRIYVIMRKDL